MDFSVRWIDKITFIVQISDAWVGFRGTHSMSSSVVGMKIFENKAIVKDLLAGAGIPVAGGELFCPDKKEDAKSFVKSSGKFLVIKPIDSNYG